MPRDPVSVVVPTRNRVAQLRRCLHGVRAQLSDDDQLVVVDSAGDDAAAVAAAAHAHAAQVVRVPTPGASKARNAGWRAATRDVVVFVDDDVVVEPGWLNALVAPLGADADLAFVSGRMSAAGPGRPIAVRIGSRPVDVRFGHPSPGATGNLAVRRRWLEQVGGLDERLGPATWFAAAEDLDLLDRILAAGGRGRYDPAAGVVGDQPRTARQRSARLWAYGKGSGARLAKLSRIDPATARAVAAQVLPNPLGPRRLAPDDPDSPVLPRAPLLAAVRAAGTITGFVAGRVALRAPRH